MNVSDIITIVANQSLDSDTPDAEDKARLLRYLNQAYLYILQEINAQSNEQGEFSQTIDVVGGRGVRKVCHQNCVERVFSSVCIGDRVRSCAGL